MKRLMISAALAALLAPVAATAADPPGQAQTNAARACKALRTSMGTAAFNRAFGANASDRNAYGKCVARLAKLEQQNIDSANATCQAEQADPTFAATHGGKAFNEFYGTNANDKNAFGKCVSLKSQTSSTAEQTSSTLNPAQTCAALRSRIGSASFALLYGTNGNKRNAYGKCVSSVARTQVTNALNSAQQCRAEQDDATFAASHGGKTFAQFYGTNDNDNNAFGMCVSQKAKAKTDALVQQTTSAAKACKAEMKADAAAFRRKYGKSRTLANAFGKCVSTKVRANG